MTENNKKQNLKALNERYSQRIAIVKQGKQSLQTSDIRSTIKYYNMYLKIVADVKGVEDVQKLSPSHFDPIKDFGELLLISQVYWDLCKLFDMTPHLESEFQRTLSKFLEFTMGFKYQINNANLIRGFIKKNRHVHKKEFKEAYKKIYISSRKCYIATYCFGEIHPATEQWRVFKKILAPYCLGQYFIDFYYYLSPLVVDYCLKFPRLTYPFTHFIIRPLLLLGAFFINFLSKYL